MFNEGQQETLNNEQDTEVIFEQYAIDPMVQWCNSRMVKLCNQ